MAEVVVTELNEDLRAALDEKEDEAGELLGAISGTPKEVVESIMKKVDEILSEDYSEDELRKFALQLGAVWGKMVEKEYGWSWKHLNFGGKVQGIYLVSPKEYYSIPPLYFLDKILAGNNPGLDGNNDNTVLLLFNMLDGVENKEPGEKYQVLT
jgi:hypothetical protein